MKKYKIVVSNKAKNDTDEIISYISNNLLEEIIADKYKILFKKAIKSLEDIAGNMPILDERLTGIKFLFIFIFFSLSQNFLLLIYYLDCT